MLLETMVKSLGIPEYHEKRARKQIAPPKGAQKIIGSSSPLLSSQCRWMSSEHVATFSKKRGAMRGADRTQFPPEKPDQGRL